ncbi:hypothetical protein N7489_002703 [Penicillium chrysogenum]|uniref:Uncharacterized protein n=1 Tax=Penicillium chrysogenum TaxID=5076 RepID=A0ABQ8WNH6_PENCH|nr:uncharacterized protein N7489_002703 [Penicillium chrysogenum]KAJ5252293.1 hypothetical protein N7489_002703 [Penicillium chrysogenum]KAJ5271200.1 hypothetical protein N7505_006958 [Penicillium chrysogenum]
MRVRSLVEGLCLLLPLVIQTSLAIPHHWRNYQTRPASKVFQLEQNGTWFENLAVRSNGNLIATRIDSPELWSIVPSGNTSHPGHGSLLLKFPNALSTLGIAEIDHDVFAILAGNISLPGIIPTPGSFVVWTVNLTSAIPEAKVLAPLPGGYFLDGMTKFGDDLLLISDARKGIIWRLNITSGESSVALSDASMLPAPPGQAVQVGVNGLKIWQNYVYYTSTSHEIFARVPVDGNATAVGPVEIITSGFSFDDFILTPNGTAYLSTNPQNEVIQVSPQGRVRLFAAEHSLRQSLDGWNLQKLRLFPCELRGSDLYLNCIIHLYSKCT